jgi:trimeric autotransporter adhesin
MSLSPTSVSGGNPCTGTVTLNGRAPSGGTSVALSSSATTVATVPSSVVVAAGQTTANFTVTTKAVIFVRTVTISGSRGVSRSATLTVTP